MEERYPLAKLCWRLDSNTSCIIKQFYDKFVGNSFPNTCIIVVHQLTISKIPLSLSDLYYFGTACNGLLLENSHIWMNSRQYGSHHQNGPLHFVNPVPCSSSWWTVSMSLYASLDNSDIIYKPLQTTSTFRMTNKLSWAFYTKNWCQTVCLSVIFSGFINSEIVSSNLSFCSPHIA